MVDLIKACTATLHGQHYLVMMLKDNFVFKKAEKSEYENNSSVRLENGCSEIGKIEGEVFFPRENFHFPRSDSCLAERSEGRQSRSRKRKILSRKRNLPEIFSIEEQPFSAAQIHFF